jgi:SSS family solute:Na+ symporter
MTDPQVAKLARVMVVVIGLISLCLAVYSSTTLVSLLLTGYAVVSQFFPGVVLGLYWKRVTMTAVFAGMIAGVGAAIFLMLTHRDPWSGWSAGFLALCLNFLITTIMSLLTRANTAPSLQIVATGGSSLPVGLS